MLPSPHTAVACAGARELQIVLLQADADAPTVVRQLGSPNACLILLSWYAPADAKEPQIVLLQADADAPTVYSGALSKSDIAKWVEKAAAPAIVTLDQ